MAIKKNEKKPPQHNGAAKHKTSDNNISKRYPNGRTLKTQDKYLPIDKKGKSDNPKSNRRVAIVDSNRYDELAVVRLTTKKQANTTYLNGYSKGKGNGRETYFKHFVETMDDEGKPIKVDGKKFIENSWSYDLSPEQIAYVQKGILSGKRQSQENKKKIAALKASDGKKGKKKR